MALGWAASSASAAAVDGWLASGSRLLVRFAAAEDGLVLDVPA
jgi:hypothetical protein